MNLHPSSLPGQHVPAFRFFDSKHQPVQCDLVVSPAQGWALATEPAGAKGNPLAQGAGPLAAKICEQDGIEPAALVLIARTEYTDNYAVLALVHFAQGGRDLFEGIRFTEPRRELLTPEQEATLADCLSCNQTLPAEWRAIRLKTATR